MGSSYSILKLKKKKRVDESLLLLLVLFIDVGCINTVLNNGLLMQCVAVIVKKLFGSNPTQPGLKLTNQSKFTG